MQPPFTSSALLVLLLPLSGRLSTALPVESDIDLLDLSPRGYENEGVASLTVSTFPNIFCDGRANSKVTATYNNNNPVPVSFGSVELSRPLLANETIDFSVQAKGKAGAGKPGVPKECTKFDEGLRSMPLNQAVPGTCYSTTFPVTCWRLRIPKAV